MRRTASVDNLIEEGVTAVVGGRYAEEVARALIRTRTISDSDLSSLAAVGLAKRISDEMARRRRPARERERSYPTAKELGLTQKEALAIHDRLGCKCGMSVHAKIGCVDRYVGHALRAPDKFDLEKEIARRRKEIAVPAGARIRQAIDTLVGQSLKGIVLACDDGMKSLLDFTRADVIGWAKKAETMSASWAQRAEWFDSARSALGKSGANAIKDLPDDVLGRLAQKATQVWQGSDAERSYAMAKTK